MPLEFLVWETSDTLKLCISVTNSDFCAYLNMGKRTELSVEDRTKIIVLRQNTAMSMRAIGESVGCSVSCVKNTLDR